MCFVVLKNKNMFKAPIPRGFAPIPTQKSSLKSQGVAELHQDGIRVVGGQAGQTFRFFESDDE